MGPLAWQEELLNALVTYLGLENSKNTVVSPCITGVGDKLGKGMSRAQLKATTCALKEIISHFAQNLEES